MLPRVYNKTIENVTVALLDTLDEVYYEIVTSANVSVETRKVPINWGPWSKLESIRLENYTSEGGTKYYQSLPRMALSGPTLSWDPERSTSINELRYFYNESNSLNDVDGFFQQIQPVPYNFEYTLEIRSHSMDQWCQIVEQILPAFNPALYLSVKEFSYLNVKRQLPVVMGGATPNFENEPSTESNKRYISANIPITIAGFIYHNQDSTNKQKLIKYINSNYYVDMSTDVGGTSAVMTETYHTSGYEADTSGSPTSAVPTSGYEFSGYSDVSNAYWFTSAESYDI